MPESSSTTSTSSTSSSTTRSGYSSYSPISTLEKQYASPVGQRLFVFVQGNASCCVEGGVEAVLKLGGSSSSTTTTSSSSGYTTPPNIESEESQQDPFGFLTNNNGSESTTTTANTSSSNKKFGTKFMQSIKKTTKTIERGMHSMAIKADKGRNKDWYVCGLYQHSTNALVCMTDSVHEVERSLNFVIPLTIPPTTTNNQIYTLKLWIRSGATLLKQTKAAKNYLVGSVTLSTELFKRQLSTSCGTHVVTALDLESRILLANPQLQLCVTTDLKFPVLCGPGWSMTDPNDGAYSKQLHHLPLDQSYGYASPDDSSWLIATERSTESTVVLPLATAVASLASQAASISYQHARLECHKLLSNRHDSMEGTNACVEIGISHLIISTSSLVTATCSMAWQRPDSIFEVELLPPSTRLGIHADGANFVETIAIPFHAKICTIGKDYILPSVLKRVQQGNPAATQTTTTTLLGNVRLVVQIQTNSRNDLDCISSSDTSVETWQAIVPLEPYNNNNNATSSQAPLSIPLHHVSTRAVMGHVLMKLNVTSPTTTSTSQQQQQQQDASSLGGLVSLVGLDTFMEDSGVLPVLDYSNVPSPAAPTSPPDPAQQIRKSQLQSMGNFVTHQYLNQHLSARQQDASNLKQRHEQYQSVLNGTNIQDVESWQDKTPKPFRPSSSRNEELLAGIGFNIHNQSLSLNILQHAPGVAPTSPAGAVFSNITCGAPADHARGFGNALSAGTGGSGEKSTTTTLVGTISGGLRRLESKRLELAKALTTAQNNLIAAVGQQMSLGGQTYISARNSDIAAKRWTVFETTQALHSLTWTCAMRRINCFSQALGIAVSSYLVSLSDVSKLKGGWPDVWKRHGYLVTYEGLLSAAGKELGMIEDASVGIDMLRRVKIILTSADGAAPSSSSSIRVHVVNSPYLRYVDLSYSGVGQYTEYRLEIGMDTLYYQQRIPAPLHGGASVQLYAVLFQVGVDIRQWGAHAGLNVKNNLTNSSKEDTGGGGSILLDDDDDDAMGQQDNDVLVALNYEAFQKMNAYALTIHPSASSPTTTTAEVHPMMKQLHSKVMSSAGKMVHGIVDDAAQLTQQLGGGGVVFCKSGKDRTAMQVTFKQSQFVHGMLVGNRSTGGGSSSNSNSAGVYENATLMRIYGTRLPICEKNVGQALFAFNALQVKFMPDMLKPPPNTLAGFLKGGRVFSREGAIES